MRVKCHYRQFDHSKKTTRSNLSYLKYLCRHAGRSAGLASILWIGLNQEKNKHQNHFRRSNARASCDHTGSSRAVVSISDDRIYREWIRGKVLGLTEASMYRHFAIDCSLSSPNAVINLDSISVSQKMTRKQNIDCIDDVRRPDKDGIKRRKPICTKS